MSFAVSDNPAAVLTAYGHRMEIRNVPVPDPEPGAIIVEIAAATMCGTDVHLHAGDLESTGFSKIPMVLGHEMVGRVVAVNGDRRDALGRPVRIGDRIAWAYAWCGECYYCAVAKEPTLCEFARQYGWGSANEFPFATGGYARFAYVLPACKVVKVPEAVSDTVAASTTCALRTVVHGVERIGGFLPHETVVIQGCGAVGLFALAYVRASGAGRVIVIGDPDDRLRIASDWGADEVIGLDTTSSDERVSRIRELTDGRGADAVIECAGSHFALEEGVRLGRRGARYLVMGQSSPHPARIVGTAINQGQLSIVGSVGADISHYAKALQFVERYDDRFDFTRLLGNQYGLLDIDAAISSLAAGLEIKPVILPTR